MFVGRRRLDKVHCEFGILQDYTERPRVVSLSLRALYLLAICSDSGFSRAMIMEQISSEDPESEEYDKEFNEIIKKEWKRLHRASTRHEASCHSSYFLSAFRSLISVPTNQLSVEVRAYKAQYGPMDELDPDDKTVAGEDNDIRYAHNPLFGDSINYSLAHKSTTTTQWM